MRALEDKVVLLTGGARGVGETLSREIVDAGARLMIGDVLEDEGRAVASALGESARFEKLDVTREDDWTAIVEQALSAWGRIDALVNNAAILHIGSVENTPPETFRRVLDVNTVGPFLGTRAVTGPMRARSKGSIVHVSSIDGLIGMNGVAAYSTSKWGLRGLARSSALDLGRDGIRVNTVCPASGNPSMFGPWMEKIAKLGPGVAAYSEDRAIPGGVSFEAIAGAVLYLASDASNGVTGIDLPVDGGAVAGHYIEGFSSL